MAILKVGGLEKVVFYGIYWILDIFTLSPSWSLSHKCRISFSPSLLPVQFPTGFLSPCSLWLFLLNRVHLRTSKYEHSFKIHVFPKGSRSDRSIDAGPVDYSYPSFRHNSATLWVVKLFSPPFEIHLEHQTLPLPQCWFLKPGYPLKYMYVYINSFLFILSFSDINLIKKFFVLLLQWND